MLGSGLGFRIALGCKVDKIILRTIEGARGLLRAAPFATNCWPEAPEGEGGLASWDPRSRTPPPSWGIILSPKLMILQGVGYPISYIGVCCTNDPQKWGIWRSCLHLNTPSAG